MILCLLQWDEVSGGKIFMIFMILGFSVMTAGILVAWSNYVAVDRIATLCCAAVFRGHIHQGKTLETATSNMIQMQSNAKEYS